MYTSAFLPPKKMYTQQGYPTYWKQIECLFSGPRVCISTHGADSAHDAEAYYEEWIARQKGECWALLAEGKVSFHNLEH